MITKNKKEKEEEEEEEEVFVSEGVDDWHLP